MPTVTLPSPFPDHPGRLHLLRPVPAGVQARLREGGYPHPFVLDDGECLYLYLDISLMQSAMRLAAPDALELAYTRQMMACLLFKSRPRRLLLIGLGGGSLAKFCYRRLPGAEIDVVDIDPAVVALRDLFRVPADDGRFRVHTGDGIAFLQAAPRGIDILLLDAFDRTGFAASFGESAFFETVRDRLSGSGILVVNLAGEPATYAGLVGRVMTVFDDRVIVVAVPEDGNHILYAFKSPEFDPRWSRLALQARELKARFGIDFPRLAEKLERAARRGVARRLLSGEYL